MIKDEEKKMSKEVMNTQNTSTVKRDNQSLLAQNISERVQSIFEEKASGSSSMANYWMPYIKMVDVLRSNIQACRTQFRDDFLSSMYLMLPWMKIYDSDKTSRLLPGHWAYLHCLPRIKAEIIS